MHDEEVRVVDVQLDALEERLDGVLLGLVTVEQVLGVVRKGDLTRHGDLLAVFQTDGALLSVRVIKDDRHARFRDSCLPTFVDEVLLILSPHLLKGLSAQEERKEAYSRTDVIFVIPSTKQIASRILDFPEPFSPVMALNDGSHPVIWVRTG